mmetsp:Transcript_14061/g.36113  ORF Transcript_14061/g.36113 Transcript_14061/m.36113 type:complete len:190 (-) Transcript_14061:109-678(-)
MDDSKDWRRKYSRGFTVGQGSRHRVERIIKDDLSKLSSDFRKSFSSFTEAAETLMAYHTIAPELFADEGEASGWQGKAEANEEMHEDFVKRRKVVMSVLEDNKADEDASLFSTHYYRAALQELYPMPKEEEGSDHDESEDNSALAKPSQGGKRPSKSSKALPKSAPSSPVAPSARAGGGDSDDDAPLMS